VGNVGELNQVAECRLEILASPAKLNNTIKAMLKAHPFEEVAYDVYEVLNPQAGVGLGRVGNLAKKKTLGSCIELWEGKLGCRLRVAGDLDKPIERVAVCGGSGADLVGAAKSAGADVLITGDVKHHAAHAALDAGLAIVDAGHAETERLVVPELAKLVRHALKENALDAEVVVSEIDTSPWSKGREI
jgi:putative NIF3 family GTP cyclohydrolase 1 type 2